MREGSAGAAPSLRMAGALPSHLGTPLRAFPTDFMKNFLRVVQLTLRRRYTFAAAVACSLGVAFFWGGNLAMLKPVVDVVFSHGKKSHELADAKVDEAKEKLATTNTALGKVAAELAAAPPEKERELKAQHDGLLRRRKGEIDKLELA